MLFKHKVVQDQAKYTLGIDGNYFFSRTFLSMGITFKENPQKDFDDLSKALSTSFSAIIRTYAKSLSEVIFVRDSNSWRKTFDAAIPFEKSHLVLDGYKANRIKDDSINWTAAYECYDAFIECLKIEFNVICLECKGAEGDDWLYFIKDQIVNINGGKLLIFSSDGDIQQLVDDKTFILKPMPGQRENKLVATKNILETYFEDVESEQDIMSKFGGETPKLQDDVINMYSRENIMVANPAQLLITKVIYGDAKDNVHELFHWKKADGKGKIMTFKPAGTIIKNALKDIGVSDILNVTIEQIYDQDFIDAMVPMLLIKSNLVPSTAEEIAEIPLKEFLYDRYVEAKDAAWLAYNESTKKNKKEPVIQEPDYTVEIRRCVNLTTAIWIQNLKLLHLHKDSIPVEVMDAMQEAFDLALTSPKRPDIDTLSKYTNILAKMKTTDKVFAGLDNTIEKEELDSEIAANPSEINDIMAQFNL